MATDYEKKYKEALERAKKMMESKRKVVVEKQALETIFPELAESEDERIRKEIIHYILYKANGVSEKQEHEWIAYLEKQKEQKPVEIHVDNPNVEKFDPDVKITTSDSSADGKELLYVCNKSYDIGFRDGVASVKPAEWSAGEASSWKPSEEQLPGIEDPGIPGKDFIPVDWVDACEKYGKWKIVKVQ